MEWKPSNRPNNWGPKPKSVVLKFRPEKKGMNDLAIKNVWLSHQIVWDIPSVTEWFPIDIMDYPIVSSKIGTRPRIKPSIWILLMFLVRYLPANLPHPHEAIGHIFMFFWNCVDFKKEQFSVKLFYPSTFSVFQSCFGVALETMNITIHILRVPSHI